MGFFPRVAGNTVTGGADIRRGAQRRTRQGFWEKKQMSKPGKKSQVVSGREEKLGEKQRRTVLHQEALDRGRDEPTGVRCIWGSASFPSPGRERIGNKE